METIYSIYKITNLVNKKVYIGFTRLDPEKRFQEHIKNSKRTPVINYSLYKAFRKYNISNFIFNVIYQSKDGRHTLKIMEPYFIKQYNSFKFGYNMTSGGDGVLNYKHSQSTKDLIKNKRKLQDMTNHRFPEKAREARLKQQCKYNYSIIFNSGKIITTNNLNKFAKDNGYNQGNLYSLMCGKNKYVKDIVKIIKH